MRYSRVYFRAFLITVFLAGVTTGGRILRAQSCCMAPPPQEYITCQCDAGAGMALISFCAAPPATGKVGYNGIVYCEPCGVPFSTFILGSQSCNIAAPARQPANSASDSMSAQEMYVLDCSGNYVLLRESRKA